MTNPDYRALCAELAEELHEHTCLYEGHESELVARARTLLAEPVAEGPTDDEIEEWADACSEAPPEEMDPEVHGWRRCFTTKEFSETIRAALDRWGHPAASYSGELVRMDEGCVQRGNGNGAPATPKPDIIPKPQPAGGYLIREGLPWGGYQPRPQGGTPNPPPRKP